MTNNLTLGIIEARNLKAMDINGKSGKSLVFQQIRNSNKINIVPFCVFQSINKCILKEITTLISKYFFFSRHIEKSLLNGLNDLRVIIYQLFAKILFIYYTGFPIMS